VLDAPTGALRGMIKNVWYRPPDQLGIAIAGNRLIAITPGANDQLTLQAFDAHSLSPLWRSVLPVQSSKFLEFAFAPLIVANNQLVVAKDGEQLDVFDAQTGTFRVSLAKIETGADLSRMQLVGPVLYRSDTVSLTAFDASSGATLWTFAPESSAARTIGGMEATPRTIYVLEAPRTGIMVGLYKADPTQQVWLVALDAGDGQERWRKVLVDGGILNTSILPDWATASQDAIYATGIAQNRIVLKGFSAQNASERWHLILSGSTYRVAATEGNRVFVTDVAARWRYWFGP
jgi:outer membrane protein assembly factor BamB